MFLRANAGKEMGFALAQPCQLGNLRFPRRETRWPGFFFVWGAVRCLDGPFLPPKTEKGDYYAEEGLMRCLLAMLLGQGRNLWRLACCVFFFH
jgi:hypothetical protein